MRRRPSRFGYWFGGAIFLLAVAGGLALLVGGFRVGGTVADYPRVPVPGQGEVSLGAGEQVIFLEPDGVEEGESSSTSPASVRVASAATGRPVPLRPYLGSFTYDFAGRSGRAYQVFRTAAPGRYTVAATAAPSSAATNLAVGPPFGRRFATLLVAGIVLLIAGPLVGLTIVLITAILRHVRNPDRRQARAGAGPGAAAGGGHGGGAGVGSAEGPGAGAAGGGAAGAAAPRGAPPGWYGDPHGQARLRYWDGSGWTDHTAA